MSSPPPGAALPTPMQKEQSRITSKTNGTNPSTPTAHPTPSATTQNNFLSPNASRVSGKSLGKTLATHQSSPAVGTGTPNLHNAVAMFDSPSFAGMEAGGSSMGISLSGLGLGMGLSASAMGASSMGGKLDDAERRRRLEAVLSILSQDTGRVCPEGLERLSRRMGMDMYSETSEKDLLMTLASGAYAIDVTFSRELQTVQHVALQFHGLADAVSEQAPAAAAILYKDLQSSPTTPIVNARLDRFADNLTRLSQLDRLSVTGANCFEAVAGVYASLERLYRYEKNATNAALAEGSTQTEEQLALLVMTSKSGQPLMHARRRLGLSLDYWKTQRLCAFGKQKAPSVKSKLNEMDIDKPSPERPSEMGQIDDKDAAVANETYALIIECEHCPPALYQSIRVTNDWLSPQVVKQDRPDGINDGVILDDNVDWNDPPQPTLAPSDPDAITSNAPVPSTQTQARFVARVEPSVVLPFTVSAQILASVGIDISQEMAQIQAQHQTYDGLVMGRDRPAESKLSVTVPGENMPDCSTQWRVRTYVARPEYGRRLDAIPFAHPRQLLPILPVLRQYTLLNRILQSVGGEKKPAPAQDANRHLETADKQNGVGGFLDSPAVSESYKVLDVVLQHATPLPRLAVTVPSSRGPCSFLIEIHVNGEIDIGAENDSGLLDQSLTSLLLEKKTILTRALAICEDLPTWAEWISLHVLDQ